MDTARQDTLRRAFDFIAPKGPGRDWKDRIDFRATEAALDYVCELKDFTLEDLREAIVFFTATVPTIERRSVDFGGGDVREMVFITADGYRAGPAGDN